MLPSRNTEVSPPPQNRATYESPFASTSTADHQDNPAGRETGHNSFRTGRPNTSPQRAPQRQPSGRSRSQQGQRHIERNPISIPETNQPQPNDQPRVNSATHGRQRHSPIPHREAPVAFEIPALTNPMARESQTSASILASIRTAPHSSPFMHQTNQQSYRAGPHSTAHPFQFGNPRGIEPTRPTDEYQQSASDQRNQPSTRRRRVRSVTRQPGSDPQAGGSSRRFGQVQSYQPNEQTSRPVFDTRQNPYPNGSVRGIVAGRPDMSEDDRALILAMLNEETQSSSNPNPPQHFRYPNPSFSDMPAFHNMVRPVFPDAYPPYNTGYNRVVYSSDEDEDEDGGRLLNFGDGIHDYHTSIFNPIRAQNILASRSQIFGHIGTQFQIPEGASYEELLQLDEKNVVVGLPKARRNGFEIRTISKQCELECSICLCNYEAGDKVMSLFCSHEFHDKCINDWFDKKPICPVCRFDYMEA